MSGAETPVLRLSGVGKSYGRHRALDSVSFEIAEGSFVGLLGPNGAGKSTLFQIVSGLFVPDEGEVALFGLDFRGHAPAILSRLGVVFQSRAIDLDLTVEANLKFHGRLFGLSGRSLADRISEVCDRLGIADRRRRLVRTLSGGEQRRVEVARALLNRPRLLLMDEPTAGLDPASRRKLVAHIHQLVREQATSTLWATHLVDELDQADWLVVLDGGHVVASGPPDEVVAGVGARTLDEAYDRLVRPARSSDAE